MNMKKRKCTLSCIRKRKILLRIQRANGKIDHIISEVISMHVHQTFMCLVNRYSHDNISHEMLPSIKLLCIEAFQLIVPYIHTNIHAYINLYIFT